uniref:Uncharacterized protein n=1 Tax=Anguilla anguilla TaxID=7936 RepID=A0A0E9VK46_ANGAN
MSREIYTTTETLMCQMVFFFYLSLDMCCWDHCRSLCVILA